MAVLKELHGITKELHDHLDQPLPEDDGREEYIEAIESYLGRRQMLMTGLTRPDNETDERLATELIEMNKQINSRMNAIQGKIRMDISQLKKRKSTGKKYESPYDGPTADGVFFDSKK
ncbi:hypothetical protein [Salipaludibacillus aurantiacus]|uniref:Flagellar protein FliT n=1 Tax=Salipaludibacillus aurantiacus TaxID=1601833 RepID=A0A1H9WXU1_9BACI|nr:hypothetical protein [Salipaludibacillus aurantiacus]SES38748.1 flagellar protein FliT [Salipaludibacillus aurantiacus]